MKDANIQSTLKENAREMKNEKRKQNNIYDNAKR